MRHDGVAELMKEEGVLILRPVPILLSSVEIKYFVSNSELRQYQFIAVRQFVERMFGERVQVFNDGPNSLRLQVGEAAHRRIMELLIVMIKGVELQVMY